MKKKLIAAVVGYLSASGHVTLCISKNQGGGGGASSHLATVSVCF